MDPEVFLNDPRLCGQRTKQAIDIFVWRHANLTLILGSGIAWGLSALLIYPAGNLPLIFMFVPVVASLAAAVTVSHDTVRFGSVAWSVPAMAAYAMRCYYGAGEAEQTTGPPILPAAHQPAQPLAVSGPRKSESIWTGRGTIQPVDDEHAVRDVGKRMLELIGFEVLEASDGIEALEAYSTQRDNIACVVLDLSMPRLDGE